MQTQLLKTATFNAAHFVPTYPDEKGRRLHGHTFSVDVLLEGPVDSEYGWLMDFGQIRQAFSPIVERLDHSYLNEIEGLEDHTVQTIGPWIFERLKPSLPLLDDVFVRVLGDLEYTPRTLLEDENLSLPERFSFTLESAHQLPRSGVTHKCSRLHGHSFRIEVAANSMIHLFPHLKRVHDRLDHRHLNEIEGLDNPTSENLAMWIWRLLREEISDLRLVVVRESPESACVYRGE